MSVVIEQPDVEAWVWENLRRLHGITSFVFAANAAHPWQAEAGPWVYVHSLQVDCRASRKRAARDLAEAARQLVVGLLVTPWAEGVISNAVVTEGPFWLPDDDGAPRYVTRWELTCHPAINHPGGNP
jgi:predicted TIM-barrel fold metal-dependent hydrolase